MGIQYRHQTSAYKGDTRIVCPGASLPGDYDEIKLADCMWDSQDWSRVNEFLITLRHVFLLMEDAHTPESIFSRNDEVGYIGRQLRFPIMKRNEQCAVAGRISCRMLIIIRLKPQPDQCCRLGRGRRYPRGQDDKYAEYESHDMALYSGARSVTITRRHAVVDLRHSGCPKVDALPEPVPFTRHIPRRWSPTTQQCRYF